MADEVTAETVRLAYRLFLGRSPENESVVTGALAYRTIPALRAAFLDSPEFRGIVEQFLTRKPPLASPPRVPIAAAPIEVEWRVDDATAQRLLAHVKATWTRLGQERPHWSVLSAKPFLPEEIARNEAAFFASGAGDVRDLIGILRRHGVAPAAIGRIFEFGCGIGRVTAHLAKLFRDVAVCDVSPSHMAIARDVVAKSGAGNVTFDLAESAAFGMTGAFDLWFSRIVLQHNPPPITAMILRRALTLLAPGGFAVFQVPTHAIGYRFKVAEYLSGLGQPGGIEMHVLPQPVVFEIIRDRGCEPREILEDFSAGPSASWNSTTFVVRKRQV